MHVGEVQLNSAFFWCRSFSSSSTTAAGMPAMPSSYQCRHFAPSCSVRLGSLLRLLARTSPEQLPKPKSKLPEPEYFWLPLSPLNCPVPRQLPDCRHHRHPADHKHLLEEQFVCATEGRKERRVNKPLKYFINFFFSADNNSVRVIHSRHSHRLLV